MKKLTLLLISYLFLLCPAKAEWRYLGQHEMISSADLIAIVRVGKIEPATDTKFYARTTYPQKASATVEKVLKGNLKQSIMIYGGTNSGSFQCYPGTPLVRGRCLVFLKYNGNFLTSINADLGIRPIKNGSLEWYGESASDRKSATLPNVLRVIKSELTKPSESMGMHTL